LKNVTFIFVLVLTFYFILHFLNIVKAKQLPYFCNPCELVLW